MVASFRVVRVVLAVLIVGGVGGTLARAQAPVTGGTERCLAGEAADRYPCKNVDLNAFLPINELGGGPGVELNDIWGWTDPETGAEYALVGRTDGVAFVDVSTPTDPVYVGVLPSHVSTSPWRDVKVYQNHAYVVSEASSRNGPNHGIQVFDLTQLRSVTNPPVTFSETAHYDRFGTAHNIAIDKERGMAYVVGITSRQDVPVSADCGAGLHMVDVSTPDEPTFAGCQIDRSTGGQVAPAYTHDTQCVGYEGPDEDYQGRWICFNANENQINIADVTDPSDPKTITNATYPNAGYVHQAWLTEDQRYLLVDDEADESRGLVENTRTLVFDITDLDTPELVTTYLGPTPSSDHNQYVDGRFAYQANYKSGLRILDVGDPESPKETAYFDTYPRANTPGFEGAWSVYPFFESGTVVVSSIGEGLFVLDPRPSPILSFDASVEGRTGTIQWTVSGDADYTRTEVEHRPPEADRWQRLEGSVSESGSAGADQRFTVQTDLREPGTHQFRVRLVRAAGEDLVTDPVSVRVLPDERFTLKGLPNPIRGRQTFSLILREDRDLRVDLYDSIGRRVATLYDGVIEAGARKPLTLDPPASGVYFLRAAGETASITRKVVVVR